MEKILFLVDSPGDLNREDLQDKPIWVVPVHITYEGKEYLEYYDIDIRAYWKKLSELEDIPITAQATPNEWIAYYTKAQSEGYTHILVHTISATASGNYTSACIASRLFMDDGANSVRIEVVDSRSYAFIYGRNVLRAEAMAREGASFDEIHQALRDWTSRNYAILWVYTLKHLKKSGRISGMSAIVGESLGIRPSLLIKDGVIAPVSKVRGDKNIVPKSVSLVKSHIVNPADQDVVILHSDVPSEEIQRTCALIEAEIAPRSIQIHELGCAIATNTGPSSMAICFYGEPFPL